MDEEEFPATGLTIMLGVILPLPNIFILFFKVFRCQKFGNILNFFHCIFTNLLLAMLISMYQKGLLVMLIIWIIHLVINIIIECKCKCKYSLFQEWCEMDHNFISKYYCEKSVDNIDEIIAKYRRKPPIIYMEGKASHEESRTVLDEFEIHKIIVTRDGTTTENYEKCHIKTHYSDWGLVEEGGGQFLDIPGNPSNFYARKTQKRTVITSQQKITIQYGSWIDKTEVPKIPNASKVNVHFYLKFCLSEEDQRSTEMLINGTKNKLQQKDLDSEVKQVNTIDDFKETVEYTKNLNCIDCMQKFKSTYCYRILWAINLLTGYSFFVETIFLPSEKDVSITIKKEIFRDVIPSAIEWGKEDTRWDIYDQNNSDKIP